jgi:hypothetical protein
LPKDALWEFILHLKKRKESNSRTGTNLQAIQDEAGKTTFSDEKHHATNSNPKQVKDERFLIHEEIFFKNL